MLKKFKVSNFRIFEEPITLDFSKVRDYKFNDICISDGLISKAIIYGKNGVGKSNLGYALLDIRNLFFSSNTGSLGDDFGYINAKSNKDAAEFTYTFMINGKEITYRYGKTSNQDMKFEELDIEGQFLYQYDFATTQGDFSKLVQFEELKHLNFTEWDNDTPVLRYILTNAKLKELMILKELSNFVEGMALLKPLESGIRFTGPKIMNKGITKTIIEENLVDDLMEFLREADINVKLKEEVKPDGEAALYFDYKRPLEFVKNASSGTKALTAVFTVLKKLDKITFLYLDEIDANLHFALSESIVNSIKNKMNCQIIITTHNTDLMSNKIMRPDCYFILTAENIVSLADATRRELREGHNLEKLYQGGEFYDTVSG